MLFRETLCSAVVLIGDSHKIEVQIGIDKETAEYEVTESDKLSSWDFNGDYY